MEKVLTLLLFISGLFATTAHAQITSHIYDNWFFGQGVALNMVDSIPKVLNNGNIQSTLEAAATISDSKGNLQFYSNGENIFNKNHQIMDNGNGIGGNRSSAQGVIVIPVTFRSNLYLVFTVENEELTNGNPNYSLKMHESIVDMNQNSGLGKVILKKQFITDSVTEGMTAVFDQITGGYGIIAMMSPKNRMVMYKISPQGELNKTPFYMDCFDAGSNETISTQLTCFVKPNPTGDKICLIKYITGGTSRVEIFDFNYTSANLNTYAKFHTNGYPIYGMEWSSDGLSIFVNERISRTSIQSAVCRYTVSSSDTNFIKKSRLQIAVHSNISQLQMAPNGIIYGINGKALFSISQKNPSQAPTYKPQAVTFSPNGYVGLPSGIEFFTRRFQPLVFSEHNCRNDTTYIYAIGLNDRDMPIWKFGDGHIDTGWFIKHKFLPPYKSNYIMNYALDTVKGFGNVGKILITKDFDSIYLGKDTILVGKTVIDAGDQASLSGITTQWSTGVLNEQTLNITRSGEYYVTLSSPIYCNKATDTIQIVVLPLDNKVPDSANCALDSLTYRITKTPGCKITWSDGSTDSAFTAHKSGTYWLTVTSGKLTYIDTFSWTFGKVNSVSLGVDTVICQSSPIIKSILAQPGNDILWSTGDTSESITISQPGMYWVRIGKGICYKADTLIVEPFSPTMLFHDTIVFCPSDSLAKVQLPIIAPGVVYLWLDNNSTERQRSFDAGGQYALKILLPSGCDYNDTLIIEEFCAPEFKLPNAFTPNADLINTKWKPVAKYISAYHCTIYNRWGERIWESSDLAQGWDGNYHGTPSPEGIYLYTLSYTGEKVKYSSEKYLHGTILLLRP